MTREDVKQLVHNHNNQIDSFISNELPRLLENDGIKVVIENNGEYKIPINAWFKAQDYINAKNFYKKAMSILDIVRPLGFDVKVNMQSNKLVF